MSRPSCKRHCQHSVVDKSEIDFGEKITLSNPDDSGSYNLDSDAEWDEEVPEITYKQSCKTYTENQDKLHGENIAHAAIIHSRAPSKP